MQIGVLKQLSPERRVGLVPAVVETLVAGSHTINVETDAGVHAGFTNEMYSGAGAAVLNREQVIANSDVVIEVSVPNISSVMEYRRGSSVIALVHPARNPEVLAACAEAGINLYAMDMMPRISRAQSMDVLSSQNNLAGYKAVIVGANAIPGVFPMMTTAAGTIKPARVLIFGAGVAGLQAIATAKRLGAVVEVTDIRPETKEQVESLGGKFLAVEGLHEVNVQGGYVAGASDDVLKRQQEVVNRSLALADLVITTALVAGGKAPTLISEQQVMLMKPGSVVVDIATDAGGNCECSEADRTVSINGVSIIGCSNLASTMPNDASQLYAKNIAAFLKVASNETGMLADVSDEIISATLVVHNGEVRA